MRRREEPIGRYRIVYGCVEVEGETYHETVKLFDHIMTKYKCRYPIDEALR